MPKPNYAYEKRQRDLAKKQKKEEKKLRKTTDTPGEPEPQAEENAPPPADQKVEP